MFAVMTWNLENFSRPTADADLAAYQRKLDQVVNVVANADPDLLAVQEVLGLPTDPSPAVFGDLRDALSTRTGRPWTGVLSGQPDPRGIRVGWLSPHSLDRPVEVAAYPPRVPATTVDDDGSTITATKRGMLAVTCTRADGFSLDALTGHFKSKLLSFPGPTPEQARFDTRDEGERARYGLYAIDQRAAESVVARAWATEALGGAGAARNVLVCGDLNDTPEAATTQILLGPPGSQLGTAGFNQPDQGDGRRLWNLAPAMPAGADWSRIDNGVEELIDQILVSAQLVRALASAGAIPIEGIRSITADPASLAATSAPSDHRPVVARFDL